MTGTQDYFLRGLDADRPFFRMSGFDGPGDPFLALTCDAGTLGWMPDARGVQHRIRWRREDPYLEADGDERSIDRGDVTLRRLDPEAFAGAVGRAFGCAAVCRELVPGRLYDLGASSFKLGRARRRIVVATRLGPLDHKLLDFVPKEKGLLLVVGSSRLDRPTGDLGERTFTLGELAMGMRGEGFDIDLKPVMDRLRAREGTPKHKTHKNRIKTLRRIKAALARQWQCLKKLQFDERFKERDAMIAQMSVKTLESLSGVRKTALYGILSVKHRGMDCDDPQIKFLWMACSSLEDFLASLKVGSDVGAFIAKALREVATYEPDEREVPWEDRPI